MHFVKRLMLFLSYLRRSSFLLLNLYGKILRGLEQQTTFSAGQADNCNSRCNTTIITISRFARHVAKYAEQCRVGGSVGNGCRIISTDDGNRRVFLVGGKAYARHSID